MTVYVRPKWWLPGMIACAVLVVIGLFIPNNSYGWPLVIIGVIGAAVFGYLEWKGRKDSTPV